MADRRWGKRPAQLPSSQRGLGAEHRKARLAALASLTDGDQCWRCGRPMYRWQSLDLDHVMPRALGGGAHTPRVLTHSACNRAAGARLANALRRGKVRKPRSAKRW